MDLSFKKFGSGKALVILHGLYGSSDNWMNIGKIFSQNYQVIIPDQRNHGRSPHSGIHTYESMSEDLLTLLNKEGIKETILLGHSMGGKTAMFFTLLNPERVSKLIVVDIAPKNYLQPEHDKDSSFHAQIINSLLAIDPGKLKSRQDADKALGSSVQSTRIRQFLLKNLGRTKEGMFEWKLNLPTLADNVRELYDFPLTPPSNPQKSMLDLPVLFIRGDDSEYIKDSDQSMIHKFFPGYQMVTIFDAGHWVHAEQTEQFIQVINDFIVHS